MKKYKVSLFHKGGPERLKEEAIKRGFSDSLYTNHSDMDESYGFVYVMAENAQMARNKMEDWFKESKDLTAYQVHEGS